MCGLDLASHGETVRSYGQPSEKPIVFGDIISLECGHRIHRVCMTHWTNVSPQPTCPMCRRITSFAPTLEEQTYLKHVLTQGWIIMTPTERKILLWTWIGVAIAACTDPIGFMFVSSLITLLTPPFLWPQVVLGLRVLRAYIVGDAPGMRICIAITAACAITSLVLLTHSTRDEYESIPSAH